MRRWLLRTHHILGSFAALLVLFYAVSGILLNHPDTFRLKSTSWAFPVMVRHYNLHLPQLNLWQAGPHWLTSFENRLLLNGKPTESSCAQLAGSVWWQQKIWINCDGLLLVLDAHGRELATAYPGEELPDEIRLLGQVEDGRPAWDGRRGQRHVWAGENNDMPLWKTTQADLRASPSTRRIPESLRTELLHSIFGRELSAWRVISDLHAGSFFGNANKLVGDLTALSLIYLASSGFYLYLSRRKRQP